MTPKSLLGLSAVTVLAVAAAVGLSLSGGAGSVSADRGRLLLPDLAAKANTVAAVTVTTAKDTMDLARKGDGFVDKSGYPVKIDAVRALMTSLTTLTIFEDKTDKPDRYADLGLADPTAKTGGATEIALAGAGGAKLAAVYAGTKDYTVGGSRGGQYVRVGGDARSYLVRGSVEVPAQRSDWFDTRLSDVDPAKIAKIDYIDRGGQDVALVGKDGKLGLATVPDGKVADDGKVDRMSHFFQRFDFQDVRPAAATPAPSAAHVRVETVDGLALTLTEEPAAATDKVGADAKGTEVWATLKAEAMKPTAEADAKAIAAKADGFAFKLGPAMAATFVWTPDVFVKDAPAAPAAPATQP